MRKKTFLKIVEYQTELSGKHLNEVRSIYKEMRGYKHDFHNHLQQLRSQLVMGETDRAIAYIDDLDAHLLNVDTLMKTGNVALDVILSCKIAQAKEKKIAITVKASVPDGLTISDADLNIVIGNLLDNAMEACEKSKKLYEQSEPFIRLYIAMKGSMLYFSMTNSSCEKRRKIGEFFTTDKKNGLHGFGLRRAKAIITEHGGWCKYNSEDGVFTSEFLVPAL